MATKNLFFKSIPVTYNAGLSDTSTTWTRTFNDRVEDTESDPATGTIVVYYNGQAILNDTGVGSPAERFYYTVSTTATTTAATALVTGHYYKITTVGTANWIAAGAATGTLGEIFVATGVTTTGAGGFAENLSYGAAVIFTLKANSAYRGPGYASGSSASTLSNYDTFNVTYYYTVYTA